VLVAVGVLGFSASAFGESVTFTYTGEQEEFVVPAGVSSILVEATGAAGASLQGAGAGGKGAVVGGDVAVKPGPLYIDVGGTPPSDMSSVGGFNGGGSSPGGGGGGGASDVRTIASGQSGSLASRLVVAAGGGGGAQSGHCIAGEGGNAEASGTDGRGEESFNLGECFGLLGDGVTPTGGGAGTQTEGGSAGSPGGEAGALGQGGSSGEDGGAGGGGLYGGGGGGAWDDNIAGGGGGGGGSNLVPAGGEAKTTGAGAEPSVTINTTPPTCSMVEGTGFYLKRYEKGRFIVREHLSTTLTGTQMLQVSSESGETRFGLTKLSSAKCEALAGGGFKFSGEGPARYYSKTGDTISFSFTVKGGKAYFSAKLRDGSVYVVNEEENALSKSNEVIH
jgi:hypothetical protein